MSAATVAEVLAIATPCVAREESCRLTAYPDPKSPLGRACEACGLELTDYDRVPNWRAISGQPWTIGWGRADPGVTPGMVCTQAQADTWRDQKLAALCDDLSFHLPWWLNYGAVRAATLLCMAYQMGVGGLLQFKEALANAAEGKFAAAAADFLASDWARFQTPARAKREVAMYLSGVAT